MRFGDISLKELLLELTKRVSFRRTWLLFQIFRILSRSKSDFISLHTPLTPDTYHLISDKELAMMKPDAILINTARGPVIDQKALYHALKSQSIGVAALDVADPEPMEEDDPLLDLDNLIILPHIASASIVTRTKMAMMAADNLLAGLRGDIPPNCVNAKELQI